MNIENRQGAGAEADDVFVFENTAGDGSTWTVTALAANVENPLAVDAADLDGDGDPDLLATGFQNAEPDLDGPVVWLANRGGQFALPTTDIAYQGMVDGRTRAVLITIFRHQGCAGDSDAELTAIELRLEDGAGVPLDSGEADALFSQIQLRRDSATGAVIATATPPYTLSSGVLTFAFADADPNLQLGATMGFPLFVVSTLQASASSASPNQFQIELVTESGSSAEDASADLLLSLERDPDTGTGVVQALPPTGDADSDGLANAVEADTHDSDPLDADTDDDALTDGVEVNTYGSDPVLKDTDQDGLLDGAEVSTYATSPTTPTAEDDGYCDGPASPGGCAAGDNCPAVENTAQPTATLRAGDLCRAATSMAPAGSRPRTISSRARPWSRRPTRPSIPTSAT